MVQGNLKRVGCDPGSIDGKWGRKSSAALEEYQTASRTSNRYKTPNIELAKEIGAHQNEVCSPPPFVGVWRCENGVVGVFTETKGIDASTGEATPFTYSKKGNEYFLVPSKNNKYGVTLILRKISTSTWLQTFTFKNNAYEPSSTRCKVEEINYQKDTIRTIQRKLNFLGYDVGKIDGIIGSKTKNAVRLFQAVYGFPQTGKLTKKEIELLMRIQD